MGFHSTGLALVDINGDGWKDVVVANGNDVAMQPVTVYYNDKKGGFSAAPNWMSSDLDYNNGLTAGDINGDGTIDIAVSVGVGPTGELGEGRVKVYFNTGSELAKTPSYESADRYSAFGCALGDADGDGDLDLAVPVLAEVGRFNGAVRIYTNVDGSLETLPSWKSTDMAMSGGAVFADINQDGFLDLAVAASNAKIYSGGVSTAGMIRIAKQPSWTSANGSYSAFFVDVGRVGTSTSTSAPSVVVSYNDVCYLLSTQCKTSFFDLYKPPGTTYTWRPQKGGLGSGIVLADVNKDGILDLITGRWGVEATTGSPLTIYLGKNSSFEVEPSYISDPENASVIETIAVADLGRMQIVDASESFSITWPRAVVTLSRQVIEEVKEVRKNGALLAKGAYTSVPGRAWISFAERLNAGDVVQVTYTYSNSLDIVAANFNCDIGNYIFYASRSTARRAAPTPRRLH
jgi:hypothetical protein